VIQVKRANFRVPQCKSLSVAKNHDIMTRNEREVHTMKKFLVIALSLTMALSFVGCKDKDDKETEKETTKVTTEETTTEEETTTTEATTEESTEDTSGEPDLSQVTLPTLDKTLYSPEEQVMLDALEAAGYTLMSLEEETATMNLPEGSFGFMFISASYEAAGVYMSCPDGSDMSQALDAIVGTGTINMDEATVTEENGVQTITYTDETEGAAVIVIVDSNTSTLIAFSGMTIEALQTELVNFGY